jgi:hypothetical protein
MNRPDPAIQNLRQPPAAGQLRRTLVRLLGPWIAFFALLLWSWPAGNLFRSLNGYGDVLEVLWGVQWFASSLWHLHSPLFYPNIFFPQGWYVGTFAFGPAMFVGMLPLDLMGGPAFAFNASMLLSLLLALAGMYRLTRLWVKPFPATIAALLFTFWTTRWVQLGGHLNILYLSALLSWLAWSLELGFRRPARSTLWFTLAGLFWAIALANTLYGLWFGALVWLVWLLPRLLNRAADRRVWWALLVPGIALLPNLPFLYWFWQARTIAHAGFYGVENNIGYGASLNSLFVPSPHNPWLRPFADAIYRGPGDESGIANLGLFASVTALAGVALTWRDRRWRPLLLALAIGIVLALGLYLRWNGDAVQWHIAGMVGVELWRLGYWLKPVLFGSHQPPPQLVDAIPLPGLLLTALIPFWEGARTVSRYIFIAGLGFFPLVARVLNGLPGRGMRFAFAALLVFEGMPGRSGSVPFPFSPHPAFDWLRAQPLNGQAVVDLASAGPNTLQLLIGGEPLYETLFHQQPSASGASSTWPAHTSFLRDWLLATPNPFGSPDLIPILRYFKVRYILLHMRSSLEAEMLVSARRNPDVRVAQCFDPVGAVSPWPYRICVLEVVPPTDTRFNVLRRDGWSGEEPWGTWIEGTEATADWVATAQTDQHLAISLTPLCAPDKWQTVSVTVNGTEVVTHAWTNCDSWQADVVIPARLIKIGWDHLALHSAYAAQPVDPKSGVQSDTRTLSVGVSQLVIGNS